MHVDGARADEARRAAAGGRGGWFANRTACAAASVRPRQYWQLAFVIPHEGYDSVRRRGLTSLRTAVAAVAPGLADRVDEITDWKRSPTGSG